MSSPSTPTGPGSHSRGVAYKQGIVVAVEGDIAYVRTTLTETIPVRRDIMRAKGQMAEVGETWMLTREFDRWTFGLILTGGSKPTADLAQLREDVDSLDAGVDSLTNTVGDLYDLVHATTLWSSFPESELFGYTLSTVSIMDATTAVAVAGNGRYICLGSMQRTRVITGAKIYVAAALAGSTIQMGLYSGPINSMTRESTATVSSATTGMKTVNWASPQTVLAGEYLAIGLATTAVGTLSVSGFENAIISSSLSAQVFVSGATSLLTTLVMGPTSPHGQTQGRHWVGLF